MSTINVGDIVQYIGNGHDELRGRGHYVKRTSGLSATITYRGKDITVGMSLLLKDPFTKIVANAEKRHVVQELLQYEVLHPKEAVAILNTPTQTEDKWCYVHEPVDTGIPNGKIWCKSCNVDIEFNEHLSRWVKK